MAMWDMGEPKTGHCAAMSKKFPNNWKALSCNDKLSFMCEYEEEQETHARYYISIRTLNQNIIIGNACDMLLVVCVQSWSKWFKKQCKFKFMLHKVNA